MGSSHTRVTSNTNAVFRASNRSGGLQHAKLSGERYSLSSSPERLVIREGRSVVFSEGTTVVEPNSVFGVLGPEIDSWTLASLET